MDINVQQTSLTKEWDFIRINSNNSDSHEEDIYVLLHIVETKKYTTHQLEVEIIPVFVNNIRYRESIYFRKWAVEVRLFGGVIDGCVKFASNGDFIIKPDMLRGKGLGTYVLGKLVRWVKQYPPELSVHLYAKSLDSASGNTERMNAMYQKYNLLEAKTISDIKESSISSKIESLDLKQFISDSIRENINSKDKNKRFFSDFQYYLIETIKLKKQRNFSIIINIVLILIAIVVLRFV